MRRRAVLAGLGGVGAGAALTACAPGSKDAATAAAPVTEPFYGARQAGITTDQQDRLVFASYDVTTTDRAALAALLRTWTAAAAAMAAGKEVPGDNENPAAPPADTGEAIGLDPARLTLTIGFGPSLFDGRFGLAGRRPAALADLPKLPPENLDPSRSGGDICVQACADDPQVAFHAVRNLSRLARGTAVARWVQLGFGRAGATGGKQSTPRNLMGFKDGTRNLRGDDSGALSNFVWVGDETDQAWMRGGSYLVARRIRMNIEAWDRDYLSDQQQVFGRAKYSGAPLSGTHELDTPDFAATKPGGVHAIDPNSHIALAAHENNQGVRILRRGYNFTDGMTATGELDAGLFFIAFQKDPRHQFVPLQRRLGAHDLLNEYIQHVGSGVYACPPGLPAGDSWDKQLFGG